MFAARSECRATREDCWSRICFALQKVDIARSSALLLNYNRGVTALEPCFVLAGTTKIDYAEDILLTENAKWIQVFSGRTGSDV